MTPREADIAYVLEDVEGVLGVYAIDGKRGGAGTLPFEIAVRLRPGGKHLAQAHYALLRAISHEECARVFFFETYLPPLMASRATPITLDPMERDRAEARIADRKKPRLAGRPIFRPTVLIVDADLDLYGAVIEAFGAGAHVSETHAKAAADLALAGGFDVLLCNPRLAFGRDGFHTCVSLADKKRADAIVFVATEGEQELLTADLKTLDAVHSYLTKPVDPEILRLVFEDAIVLQQWNVPALAPPLYGVPKEQRASQRRVLVVDRDPASDLLASVADAGFVAVVTDDEWEAIDCASAEDTELVLCSATLRTRGGKPFYRLLWNARPDIKSRFVLILDPETAPPSSAAVTRPLTKQKIADLLARYAPKS
jgi:CheY-like chemotaxis protein